MYKCLLLTPVNFPQAKGYLNWVIYWGIPYILGKSGQGEFGLRKVHVNLESKVGNDVFPDFHAWKNPLARTFLGARKEALRVKMGQFSGPKSCGDGMLCSRALPIESSNSGRRLTPRRAARNKILYLDRNWHPPST